MLELGALEKPLPELISLKGKTAVITGGTQGIGLSICRRFLEAGANVLMANKDEKWQFQDIERDNFVKEGKLKTFLLHSRSSSEMERVAKEAYEYFNGLDIWVNDAVIFPTTPMLELSDYEWESVMNTNVTGAFYGSRAAISYMKKKGGVILNISSVAGFSYITNLSPYSAAMYGIRGLTAALAKEVSQYKIRVVAIAPTYITIDNHKTKKEPPINQIEDTPMQREGLPDDVARVALFAVSDLASFISGTTIVVDGGIHSLG